jgi:hypothetical protein
LQKKNISLLFPFSIYSNRTKVAILPLVPLSICTYIKIQYICITVPDMGVGRCLGPKGNGVSLGEGGHGPPGSKEDKQSVLNENRDNMEKDEEERASQA